MWRWPRTKLFRDRYEAGRLLGERLIHYRHETPVIFALPRGGVPVGFEISHLLHAPLDVFIARKLGAPNQPELGIGAVAQGGTRVLNERIIAWLDIPKDYLELVTRREEAEVERRSKLLRGDRPALEISERTVILVDDGLATGVTARAAVAAIRERGPKRLVLAIPVCAERTAALLRPAVDELVSLETPTDLDAIGFWYEDFEQIPDAVVVELLQTAHREHVRLDPESP